MELLLKLNGMHVLVRKCDGGSDGCVLTVAQMVVF